jgi:cobalt-zinc-cadmium efflux system protein
LYVVQVILKCSGLQAPTSKQSHDMPEHGEHAGHGHAPKDFGLAFAIGAALNVIFVVVEAFYGFLANSTALLADAGHNLGDVLGLLMARLCAKRLPAVTPMD